MGDIVDWMFQAGLLDMPDPFDHEEPSWIPKQPVCKYCGSKKVWWGKLNGKWRLFTGKGVHTCNAYTSRCSPT